MGHALDTDCFIERSGRKAARRRVARREIRQGLFCLHWLLLVPAIAGRRARRLPALREPRFAARREMSLQDRPPFFGSWSKAYCIALAFFAIEVALLYAFTLRFS